MNLVYIHGAGASKESFNYIRDKLQHPAEVLIEYSTDNGFLENLAKMEKIISNLEKIVFICHSMGGLYAVHLAQKFKNTTLGAITMSTPYGGVSVANFTKYLLPSNKLLRDIASNSPVLKKTNEIEITHPWFNIVTTCGNSPLILEPNDGVVTIRSQKYRGDMNFKELKLNHYEVVISPKTIEFINKKLKSFHH